MYIAGFDVDVPGYNFGGVSSRALLVLQYHLQAYIRGMGHPSSLHSVSDACIDGSLDSVVFIYFI